MADHASTHSTLLLAGWKPGLCPVSPCGGYDQTTASPDVWSRSRRVLHCCNLPEMGTNPASQLRWILQTLLSGLVEPCKLDGDTDPERADERSGHVAEPSVFVQQQPSIEPARVVDVEAVERHGVGTEHRVLHI